MDFVGAVRRILGGLAVVAALPPLAFAGETLRTKGSAITAAVPDGSGWSCRAVERGGGTSGPAELRCSRGNADGLLYVYAKDYAATETLESICGRDWRAYYRPVIQVFSRVEAKLAGAGARRTCEVVAEGASAASQRLRLVERYAVAPGHVLLITAAGPSALLDEHRREIAAWFDGVRFAALGRK